MTPPTETTPRASETILGIPRDLARVLEGYARRLDVPKIREAYELAEEAHRGQRRASGETFVSHAVEVATILGQFKLDTVSIIAGLVHDVVEDTRYSLADVEERFGREVASVVDGVTKIGKVQFRSHTEHQAENYRKLLISMAEDARVIMIKLADRLHNMRTLEHLSEEKQQRVARETREIYAPLAHRLGMAQLSGELEDLAFKFLEPTEYEELRKLVHERTKERERQVLEFQKPLERLLQEGGIRAEVTGRPKHLWSIHRKIQRRGKPFEEVYDLMAIRVITDTVQNCYAALGLIHSNWTPIQERFHDYVATPKSNMYQSIHTTVFGLGGRRYEIQIRTEEMHGTAEYGIAAHWRYKEGEKKEDEADEALSWFRQVLEWQQDASEPEEFMEFLRMDLFQGEAFVFTPKGEVKQLPIGSTPIDFAFAVHTQVGLHCSGAKVNGRISPLSRELKNGDTVEILTSPKQTPSRDWLAFVKTSRARQRIRHWIREEEQEQSVKLGREFLDRELKKRRLVLPEEGALAEAAAALELGGWEDVYEALGRGDIGPSTVMRLLFPDQETESGGENRPSTIRRIAERLRRAQPGVRIQGLDNLMIKYSQCCQPVPGDNVIGYITIGRGVSIHRKDCPNVLNLSQDPERRIEIEWTAEEGERFLVKLYTRGTDRRGLLSDIARSIADTSTNIQHADIRAVNQGMLGEFVVEVRDLDHLTTVMKGISRVKGVLSVERREAFRESELVDLG
ncbi:MAG: bifunctional (p)ppGpp synthetase/guanosine-3',5'-bis(diphosphate) 3'-pyrophosphohydrolase [Gemmatimonadetes bacterium]|nr:bifunctional (p)ppGpp synthetase/guanosine-3',5'-bis(diphosphate) 3'-pyrophosphohydrolase [Gemmatimonadota bacterium]